jgi:alkylation response protein AidB-like acyl-CoA dehydrogenase
VANQETFAEKKGDSWVINGQKVWTSLWEHTDWMICLCRTDRSHKHKGLTYFCVPIKSEIGKSVEVRPLINVNGGGDFAEEFFKDLTVHDKYRIDEVGQGWAVTLTTLKHERGQGQLLEPTAGGFSLASKVESEEGKAPIEPHLITLAKKSMRAGKPAAEDPVIRDRMMQVIIREKGFDESNRRTAVKGLVDHPMRIPMQFKLVSTEISLDQAGLAVEVEGVPGGPLCGAYVGSFGMTIAGGTSEILRNQLGERVLGLPKTK